MLEGIFSRLCLWRPLQVRLGTARHFFFLKSALASLAHSLSLFSSLPLSLICHKSSRHLGQFGSNSQEKFKQRVKHQTSLLALILIFLLLAPIKIL